MSINFLYFINNFDLPSISTFLCTSFVRLKIRSEIGNIVVRLFLSLLHAGFSGRRKE